MSKKQKLPSLATVKKTLFADWALRVKKRDGFKCVLCGCEDRLSAHHWYACDHNAHGARYCVDNGVTLCYTCHLRTVHCRADYVTVRRIHNYCVAKFNFHESVVDALIDTELTTVGLRMLWDNFRGRITDVSTTDGRYIVRRNGRKKFLVDGNYTSPQFIPHAIVRIDSRLYEINVVAKTQEPYWRYTIVEYTPQTKED